MGTAWTSGAKEGVCIAYSNQKSLVWFSHSKGTINEKGTKSATPLGWTHGEYLKLLRSISDGAVFDYITEVSEFCKSNGIYDM
jgi:hypothetical protein